MFHAWDSDAHVFESEVTFSDAYLEPSYRHRRPIVVESDNSGGLSWAIDSRIFPTITGPNQSFGAPQTKGGAPSPKAVISTEMNSLESIEFQSGAARLEQMEQEHIDLMVNYPTMFLSWPLTYDPGLGIALCRAYNNWISDISSQAPSQLKWVTAIDPQNPAASAEEIRRTRAMGSLGVMLLGMVGDRHVDHPSLEPIWAAAAETGLPVGVHVGFCCPALGNMYDTAYSTSTIPFSFVVLLAFERIISSGLLDRYPDLRVAFLEAGCQWVPFLSDRMEEYSALPGTRTERLMMLGRPGATGYLAKFEPQEYVRRGQVYFGFEVDDKLLPFMLDQYGPDCLLFASDIPHTDRLLDSVVYFQRREDISEEAKRKLLVDNTARYYGLAIPQATHSFA